MDLMLQRQADQLGVTVRRPEGHELTARGAALIAVDGQAARPFRLGAEVAAGLVLQVVTAQQVRLGADINGPVSVTLEMPSKPGG